MTSDVQVPQSLRQRALAVLAEEQRKERETYRAQLVEVERSAKALLIAELTRLGIDANPESIQYEYQASTTTGIAAIEIDRIGFAVEVSFRAVANLWPVQQDDTACPYLRLSMTCEACGQPTCRFGDGIHGGSFNDFAHFYGCHRFCCAACREHWEKVNGVSIDDGGDLPEREDLDDVPF